MPYDPYIECPKCGSSEHTERTNKWNIIEYQCERCGMILNPVSKFVPKFDDNAEENMMNLQLKKRDTCIKCGAHCCWYGGVLATKEEVNAICEGGHQNYFIRIGRDTFVTKWQENGRCPYLQNTTCSIYNLRPLRCRAYPIIQISSGEIFLAECPLNPFISKQELERNRSLLSTYPKDQLVAAGKYFQKYANIIEKRQSRFRERRIE